MINRFYTVVQGYFSAQGNGDEWDCGRYNTLEETKDKFNEVKKDTAGISKKPNGYLETYIALSIYDDEDDCRTDNIIESYRLNY